jgi:nickel transport protein
LAHKGNVFAWVEDDTGFVEGCYSGGKKAKNALIEVFDSAGTKLVEGKTDDKGEFSFPIPVKTDLRIVLTASPGHKNDFIVSASDLGVTTSPTVEPGLETEKKAAQTSTVNINTQQLEAIINQALERKLDPVMKLVRTTRREGPSITEIIGGIGYIFGLFGVVMYFKSREQKERGQRSKVRGQQKTGTQ